MNNAPSRLRLARRHTKTMQCELAPFPPSQLSQRTRRPSRADNSSGRPNRGVPNNNNQQRTERPLFQRVHSMRGELSLTSSFLPSNAPGQLDSRAEKRPSTSPREGGQEPVKAQSSILLARYYLRTKRVEPAPGSGLNDTERSSLAKAANQRTRLPSTRPAVSPRRRSHKHESGLNLLPLLLPTKPASGRA